MAVFISVSTNAFEETFAGASGAYRTSTSGGGVRRPLRGIEIKDDTYALIKVMTHAQGEIPLVNSSNHGNNDLHIGGHSNFIVQRITEQRSEKQQIVETFGEDFIFFFGESPRILDVSGVLLNTNDFNWKSEFWENYEKHVRGTKLAEANARLYLYFDDVVVEGYMLSAGTTGDASSPYHMPFQFRLFITNYAILSQVGSVFIPDRAAPTAMTLNVNEGVPSALDQTLASGNTDALVSSAGGLSSGAGAAGGGLISFLSAAGGSGLAATADFNIQQTLENVRNTFFGRQINIPGGIGSQIRLPPIQNRGTYPPGERGLPIHRNFDEYVSAPPREPAYDGAELQRQTQELALRSGDALEQEARRQLAALGIDSSRREVSALLVGRGAFAATQVVGSFGIRQADLLPL